MHIGEASFSMKCRNIFAIAGGGYPVLKTTRNRKIFEEQRDNGRVQG